MSIKVMTAVWERSQHSGSHLLMLLAIADFSDDQGNAYPAVPTLAEKCRMKQRNAQMILATLKESGELEIRANEGPKGTNLYRIVVGAQGMQGIAPPQKIAPPQILARGDAKACAKGMQGIAPEPSMNHQEPSEDSALSSGIHRAGGKNGPSVPRPLSVGEQTWVDWLALRKAKKAPVTETVLAQAKREADKAGMSLDAFLQVWCLRGSQGLQASWLKPHERGLQGRCRQADFSHANYGGRDATIPA